MERIIEFISTLPLLEKYLICFGLYTLIKIIFANFYVYLMAIKVNNYCLKITKKDFPNLTFDYIYSQLKGPPKEKFKMIVFPAIPIFSLLFFYVLCSRSKEMIEGTSQRLILNELAKEEETHIRRD